MGDAPEHTLRLIGLVFLGAAVLFGSLTGWRIHAVITRWMTPRMARRLSRAFEPVFVFHDFVRDLVACVCCVAAGVGASAVANSLAGFEANDTDSRVVGWLTYLGSKDHQRRFELEWVTPGGRLRFPKVRLTTPGNAVTLSYTMAKVKPSCIFVNARYLLKIDSIRGGFVGPRVESGIVGRPVPVVLPLLGGRSERMELAHARQGSHWFPESVWLDTVEFYELTETLSDDPSSWVGATWRILASPSGLSLELMTSGRSTLGPP